MKMTLKKKSNKYESCMFIEERNKILVKRGVMRTLEIQGINDSIDKEIKYFLEKQTNPDLELEKKGKT